MANAKNIDDELSHDYSFDIEPVREDEIEEPKKTTKKNNKKKDSTNTPTSSADAAAVAAYDTKGKDKIALVIALVFVAALAFFGFRYFSDASSGLLTGTDSDSELSGEDIMAAQTERGNEGGGVVTEPLNGDATATTTVTKSVFVWIPNDYNQGDIGPGNYDVQDGDTLWEISEAVYGNGADWVRILDANSDSIGYLSNGQQSLIFAGQTLVIPT